MKNVLRFGIPILVVSTRSRRPTVRKLLEDFKFKVWYYTY